MKKIILSIDGMTCSACSNGLEKYLNKQNGIIEANVNLVMANATIIYEENILEKSKLDEFIKQAGFKSLGEFKEINTENRNKREKIKFIIFTILAIILMYISMGHMINLPIFNFLDVKSNPINYTICLFLFAIIFMIYGYDILKTQSVCILSDRTSLVTKSDMHNRILYEFDNRPCSEIYAEVLDVPKDQIQNYFVSNLLGIVADGEIFVRTFNQIKEDGITTSLWLTRKSRNQCFKNW